MKIWSKFDNTWSSRGDLFFLLICQSDLNWLSTKISALDCLLDWEKRNKLKFDQILTIRGVQGDISRLVFPCGLLIRFKLIIHQNISSWLFACHSQFYDLPLYFAQCCYTLPNEEAATEGRLNYERDVPCLIKFFH